MLLLYAGLVWAKSNFSLYVAVLTFFGLLRRGMWYNIGNMADKQTFGLPYLRAWYRLVAVILLGLLAAPTLRAQEQMTSSERERSDNVLAFMRDSKLETSHKFYWAALVSQISNPAAVNRLGAGFDETLARREMIKFLVKHYNPSLFREGMRWLADPLTQQYLLLQDAPLEGYAAFKANLAKTPLPSKRRTLVSRAFDATSSKSAAEHIYKLTVMAAGTAEQTMALGSLDLFANLAYRQNGPQVQQDAYDRLAYTFSPLTDDQLELLIFHLEDPVGLWALQLMRGALYSAIYITMQNVARQPADVVPEQSVFVPNPAVTGGKSDLIPDQAPSPAAGSNSDLLD